LPLHAVADGAPVAAEPTVRRSRAGRAKVGTASAAPTLRAVVAAAPAVEAPAAVVESGR
jgi:hypothetical protein